MNARKYVTTYFPSVSMLCKIIVFLGPFVVIIVDSFEVITDEVHVSYRGTMNTVCNGEESRFQALTSTKLSDCVIECALRTHCLVMNYNLKMNLCELYHLDELSSNVGVNCFRVEKKDINVTKSPCNESTCPPDTVCDRNTKFCKTKECLVPPKLTNGRVLGNLRSVGNRVKYICNRGFELKNISNDVAVCRENGSWSTEGICVANVKLNAECPAVTTEDICIAENAVCLPRGSVNTCQCIEGFKEDNGDAFGGNCIPNFSIGELCSDTNANCTHSSVRCVRKSYNKYVCHCQFGHEFDQSLGICVKVCSTYSSNSSEFKGEVGVGIDNYNLPSITFVWSLYECIQFCSENEPLFLSIERHETFGNCLCGAISKQQFSNVNGQLDQGSDAWTFYDRPCATV